jgi:hypothetical protein
MPESGLSGSVRGVPSNGHPYRDPGSQPEELDVSITSLLMPRKADVAADMRGFRLVPQPDSRTAANEL